MTVTGIILELDTGQAIIKMKNETEAAAGFWLEQLKFNLLSNEQQRIFLDTLIREMRNKFHGHWYEKDPVRGHGYRCIIYDGNAKYIDPMLLKGACEANFDFVKLYEGSACNKGIRMWVDPGEVEVESVVPPTNRKLIYRKGKYTPSQSSVAPEELYMLDQGVLYHPDYNIYYPPMNPYETQEIAYYDYYPAAYEQQMSEYEYRGNKSVYGYSVPL